MVVQSLKFFSFAMRKIPKICRSIDKGKNPINHVIKLLNLSLLLFWTFTSTSLNFPCFLDFLKRFCP